MWEQLWEQLWERCSETFLLPLSFYFCYRYHSKGSRETEVNGLDLSEHGEEGYIL